MVLVPEKLPPEILDARDITQKLKALHRRIEAVFEVTGEPEVEQVADDINSVIDVVIEMSRDIDKCRKRHSDDYSSIADRAKVGTSLAKAIHAVLTNCTRCRGPCTHHDQASLPWGQLRSALEDARRVNLFEVGTQG